MKLVPVASLAVALALGSVAPEALADPPAPPAPPGATAPFAYTTSVLTVHGRPNRPAVHILLPSVPASVAAAEAHVAFRNASLEKLEPATLRP